MKKLLLTSYILYLPFQLLLPRVFGINIVNIYLFLLIFILIVSRDSRKVRIRLEVPLFLFLFLWFLSFLHSFLTPEGMLRGVIITEFKRLFALILGYLVFSRCIKTRKELNFFFSVFLITLVLVGLITWKNGVLAGPNFADFKRSSGPFGEGWGASDMVGGFLATFTPFLLGFVLYAKRKVIQFVGIAGLGICIFGLIATYSRGSFLALILGLVLVILLTLKEFPRLSKMSTALIIISLLAATIGWKYWVPKALLTRFEGTVTTGIYPDDVTLDESSDKRVLIWKSGLKLFKDNPLFGVGFKRTPSLMGVDPHNSFIQILAEMGIFAFLAYVWFLLSALSDSVKLFRSGEKGMGVGFIGFLTSFVIVNLFYANFFRDTVVGSLWIILGILVTANKFSQKERLASMKIVSKKKRR